MTNKPKILVVDDKPENLVAIRTVLRNLDVELVEATNGNDALRATLHHDFVLALLDIQMPEIDGYELASLLREEEKTKDLPFIFISGVYTDNFNVFKGYDKGAFSFITKPFQPEILVNKVKFFISKHQQEKELFNLNNELRSVNKQLESFSYSVSHDLRSPLRAVTGYADMLQEDYGSRLDDEARRIIGNIKLYATKMSHLIDDLLAFSRLGGQTVHADTIDMNQLVEDVLQEIRRTAAHAFTAEVAVLHVIRGDLSLIRQLVYNLVSNAVKYSSGRQEPKIEVWSEEKDAEIVFAVKDNGAGFDMTYYHKLFGVFQRLHSQDEFEGTGVGLAIVQNIISKHNGRVWAESVIDEGAVFYFSLPR